MMKRLLVLFAALWLVAGPPAHAQERSGGLGGKVEVPDRTGDVTVAAGAVAVVGRVQGDALLTAGAVSLSGAVDDDVRVFAGEYAQTGAIGGELAAAAGKIEIDGAVGQDLYAYAEDVRLGPESRISQDARIGGQDVLVKGRIDGDLEVSGDQVALSAQVGGNVTIRARRIVLGPDATIEGAFTWRAAAEPDIAPDAIITGAVDGQIVERWERDGGWTWAEPWRAAPAAAVFAGEFAWRLMVGFSAFLLGLVLVLAAPGFTDRVGASVRTRWPASLAWGAAIAVGAPILSFVAMLTIIGLPLGILGILAYAPILLLGYAAGAAGLGTLLFREGPPTRRTRVLALAAGLAGLTVVAFAPLLGTLAGLAATLLGLGALALAALPGRLAVRS